jgi:hypothetical protein
MLLINQSPAFVSHKASHSQPILTPLKSIYNAAKWTHLQQSGGSTFNERAPIDVNKIRSEPEFVEIFEISH